MMTTNKRELKRMINYICSDLFAECVATTLYEERKATDEDVNALLSSILLTHSDFIKRISHSEPGLPPKKYYKNLVQQFNQQIGELVDQVCNLGL